MHMLTSAIVSDAYAETKKGFERAAEDRARAFQRLTDAQDLTTESVAELERQLGVASGQVAAIEAELTARFDELFAEVRTRRWPFGARAPCALFARGETFLPADPAAAPAPRRRLPGPRKHGEAHRGAARF